MQARYVTFVTVKALIHMKLLKLSLVLLLAAIALPIAAQNLEGCATPPYKSEWLQQFQQGLVPRVQRTSMIQYAPLNITIVGESDGSGYLNPVTLLTTIKELNSDFLDQSIQFFIRGDIKFLNSSNFYDHSFAQGRVMMENNNVPGTINVYFVGNPAGACGYYSPSRDGIAMGNNCTGVGDRTLSHEMGHFLSLPHTFFGWECVDEISNIPDPIPARLAFPDVTGCNDPNNPNSLGPLVETVERDSTNCETAGDGFCDTAPDYLMERWSCNSQGIYPDSLTDPNGDKFIIEGWNIMSYASDACQDRFSEDQKAAMLANITQQRPGLIDNEGVVTDVADASLLQQISPENDDELPASDFVELVWNEVPNADFYILQLHSSINMNGAVLRTEIVEGTSLTITEGLVARRRYYWRVRPVNRYAVCSEFSEIIRFRNGEFTVSTIDEALDAAITVAPNPASGGQALRVSGRDLGQAGRMNLELINASGQVVVSRENLVVPASGFDQTIATGDLPQGVYFLRLRLNDRLVTRRVVVTP